MKIAGLYYPLIAHDLNAASADASNQLIDSFTEFLPFCKKLYFFSSYKYFWSPFPILTDE